MWEGDADATCDLAQLLIDLRKGVHDPHADLLLVYRRDCKPRTWIEIAARAAFEKVHVRVAKGREAGFPAGPNSVWCDVMQHCDYMHRVGQWDYACILTTEGDAVPLVKDWSMPLLEEWEKAEKAVVGCLMPQNFGDSKLGHINGNAMFDARLATKIPRMYGCPQQHSWDMYFAKDFYKQGWADTPLIRNWYQKQTATARELNAAAKEGIVWLHGVKDASAREWARKALTL